MSGNTEGNVPVTAAQQRALVRRGYDTVSLAYRNDDGRSGVDGLDHPGQYHAWVDELASVLLRPARVLDLGCGCGVPATSALVDRGLDVVGVDFSPIQVARAAGSSPRPRSSKPTMALWEPDPAAFVDVAGRGSGPASRSDPLLGGHGRSPPGRSSGGRAHLPPRLPFTCRHVPTAPTWGRRPCSVRHRRGPGPLAVTGPHPGRFLLGRHGRHVL